MKKMGVLLAVVIILVCGIGMSAKAAVLKEDSRGFSAGQYAVMEEEYLSEARMILLEKGCKNAGITLTYIADAEGNRDYTITVHHAKLGKMEAEEFVLLANRLQESAEEILCTEVSLKQL